MNTSLYAALLGLVYVFLSIRTIGLRRKLKIAVGDSGNIELLRAMRAHANFAEYTPFALLLIFFVENSALPIWFVHGAGVLLLIGRTVHAYGISHVKEKFQFRVFGMVCTFGTILLCVFTLIYKFLIKAFY